LDAEGVDAKGSVLTMRPPVFDAAWPADVQALYQHDMQEIWDRSICTHIWNQYHAQLDRYLAIAGDSPKKILDVGCAQGTLALLLAEKGHDVLAVDLREQFLTYARSRHTHGKIAFVAANVLNDEIKGDFDLIFANQIVEHLVYPLQMATRLKRLLRPGGQLVMSTPNHDYFKSRLPSFRELGDVSKLEHLQFTADGDGHFFAYRSDELIDVFKQAGLERVSSIFFESPLISGHVKIRYLHSFVPASVLRFADSLVLAIPGVRRQLAHQLLVTGFADGAGAV
jgi:2-polyprenyl-3-methyl-5-hydroxy-6-metoxy-1,4-benzoquinol methylase